MAFVAARLDDLPELATVSAQLANRFGRAWAQHAAADATSQAAGVNHVVQQAILVSAAGCCDVCLLQLCARSACEEGHLVHASFDIPSTCHVAADSRMPPRAELDSLGCLMLRDPCCSESASPRSGRRRFCRSCPLCPQATKPPLPRCRKLRRSTGWSGPPRCALPPSDVGGRALGPEQASASILSPACLLLEREPLEGWRVLLSMIILLRISMVLIEMIHTNFLEDGRLDRRGVPSSYVLLVARLLSPDSIVLRSRTCWLPRHPGPLEHAPCKRD